MAFPEQITVQIVLRKVGEERQEDGGAWVHYALASNERVVFDYSLAEIGSFGAKDLDDMRESLTEDILDRLAESQPPI